MLTMLRSIVMIACLAAGSVQAGPARDSLLNFFNHVTTAKSAFSQEVLDSQQNVIQRSSGDMWLSRPGKFRWNYLTPYKQVIVADGERVWLYDVDLEQVTVRKIDNVIGNAPALLLSGNADVEKNFTVTELQPAADGLDWVELVPRQADTGFDRMRIGFKGEDLQAMTLQDSLGNQTQLVFTDSQRNLDLDPGLFKFVVPQGVDVIGDVPVTITP